METSRQFGPVGLRRVTEQCGPGFLPTQLYPGWRPEMLQELEKLLLPHSFDVAEGKFIASIHTWVVRTGKYTILIDSCSGNDKERPMIPRFHQRNLPFLQNLHDAGVAPEDVDFVACTHLHADHCGWNTRLLDGRWVPTFPRARYLFSREEYEFWSGPAGEAGPNAGVYQDSVLPVVASGQAELIDKSDTAIDGLLHIHRTPGHSPGHLAFSIPTPTTPLIFSGDLMHQPVQIAYPDMSTAFCVYPLLGNASRRRLLDMAADTRGLVCTAHFAASSAGHVHRQGESYTWNFA